MSHKTPQSIVPVALLLLAVAAEVVWSYASMHLGSFAAPQSAGAMPQAATVAFYGGYLAVAAAMVVRPRLFGPTVPPASSCSLATVSMITSSVVWSFAYGQTLFDPEAVLITGALLSGLAGAIAIAVVYPAAFALLNPASAAVVVVVAHLCKRLAAPAIDALGMGVNAYLLTYALPVVMAASLCLAVLLKKQPPARMAKGANPPASFWLLLITAGLAITAGDEGGTGVWLCLAVLLKKQPPARMAKGANPPASFWLLLITAGLAITAGDEGGTGVWSLAAAGTGQGFLELAAVAALVLAGIAGLRLTAGLAITAGDEGGTGVWSLAAAGTGQGFLELAAVAALVLAGIAGLRPLSQAPLWTRFLPVLLLTALPTLLASMPGQISACLTDASQTFYHGAAWVITFACARECRVDVRRAAGVVFIAQASSTLLVSISAGTAIAPALFMSLFVITALLATVVPITGSMVDRSPGVHVSAEPADNGFRPSLNARCRQVAQAHGLSDRETDVLCLLVEGWPRQDICEALAISEGTVKTHASHIYAKLGIQSRQDLASVVFGRPE